MRTMAIAAFAAVGALAAGCQKDDATLIALRDAQAKNDQLAERLAAVEKEQQQALSQVALLGRDQQGAARDAQTASSALQGFQNDLKAELAALRKSLDLLHSAVTANGTRLGALDEQFRRGADETLQPLLETTRQAYAEAEQKLLQQKVQAAELESQAANLRRDLNLLRAALALDPAATTQEMIDRYQRLEGRIAERQKEQARLEQQQAQAGQDAAALRERYEALLKKHQELQTVLAKQQTTMDELRQANAAFAAGAGPSGARTTQPSVRGTVTFVDQSALVALHVDPVDQVRENETALYVYRATGEREYVATLRAFEVHRSDEMRGTVIAEIVETATGKRLQKGDEVTTDRR